MTKEEKRLNDYSSKVKQEDIIKISEDINTMKKGPIAKIWCKVESLYEFMKDAEAPWGKKVVAIGALLYLISPIDAIPDFIPIVGLLDDVGVIGLAVITLKDELDKYMDKDCI